MSLLPLTVFDCIRRACRYNLLDAYSPSDMEYQLAERILAHASLADLLRYEPVDLVQLQYSFNSLKTVHILTANTV